MSTKHYDVISFGGICNKCGFSTLEGRKRTAITPKDIRKKSYFYCFWTICTSCGFIRNNGDTKIIIEKEHERK